MSYGRAVLYQNKDPQLECAEFMILENSYEALCRLTLILYVVRLSSATITNSLSSCNPGQRHLTTCKEVSSGGNTENLVVLGKT